MSRPQRGPGTSDLPPPAPGRFHSGLPDPSQWPTEKGFKTHSTPASHGLGDTPPLQRPNLTGLTEVKLQQLATRTSILVTPRALRAHSCPTSLSEHPGALERRKGPPLSPAKGPHLLGSWFSRRFLSLYTRTYVSAQKAGHLNQAEPHTPTHTQRTQSHACAVMRTRYNVTGFEPNTDASLT